MYEHKNSMLARIAKFVFPNASRSEMQQKLSRLDKNFLTFFYASLLHYEKAKYEEIPNEEITDDVLYSCKSYISRTRKGTNARKIHKPEDLLVSDLIEALFYAEDSAMPTEMAEITSIGTNILIEILESKIPEMEIKQIYDDFLPKAERKLTTTDRSNEKEKNRYNQRTREFYRKLEKELSSVLSTLNNKFEISKSDIVKKFNIALNSIRKGQERGESKDLEKLGKSQTEFFDDEECETTKNPEIEEEQENIDFQENMDIYSDSQENETRFSKYIGEFRLLFKVLKNRHHQMEKEIVTDENGKKNENLKSRHYYNMQKLNYDFPDDFKKAFEYICETDRQNYERLYFKKDLDLDLETMHHLAIELITAVSDEFENLTEEDFTEKNDGIKYLMEIIFCLNFFKIEWIKALHAVSFRCNPKISQTALEMDKAYLSIKPEEIAIITELFPDFGKEPFLIDENDLFKKKFMENLNRYRNAFEKKLQEMLKLEKEDKQGLPSEGVE
jgi:hypothetical protein